MAKRLAGLRFTNWSADTSGGIFARLDIFCDGNHRDPGNLRISITDRRGRSEEVVIKSPEQDPKMEKVHYAFLQLAQTIDNEHRRQPDNEVLVPTQYRN